MNDGRLARVQEVKTFQDLTTPRFQYFWIDFFEAFQIAEKKNQTIIGNSILGSSRVTIKKIY